MQGLNLRITIWRILNEPDDEVGGAIITGTPIYGNIRARMAETRPTQVMLEQGLAVDRIWTAIVVPGTLQIYERDELEITSPINHLFLNQRFRILGVRHDSIHPSDLRGHIELHLSRIERARAEQ